MYRRMDWWIDRVIPIVHVRVIPIVHVPLNFVYRAIERLVLIIVYKLHTWAELIGMVFLITVQMTASVQLGVVKLPS